MCFCAYINIYLDKSREASQELKKYGKVQLTDMNNKSGLNAIITKISLETQDNNDNNNNNNNYINIILISKEQDMNELMVDEEWWKSMMALHCKIFYLSDYLDNKKKDITQIIVHIRYVLLFCCTYL